MSSVLVEDGTLHWDECRGGQVQELLSHQWSRSGV